MDHIQHPPFPPPPLEIDPSPLTTQLVLREVSSLKELLFERIEGVEKGINIAHEDLVRVPTKIQLEVEGLKALLETKIAYEHQINELQIKYVTEIVQRNYLLYTERFTWIEKVRLEQKNDQTIALDTAFASAKELVGVSNAAFTKQIDQMTVLITTAVGTLGDKIGDVKDRVNASTSTTTGKDAGKSYVITMIIAGAGLIFGLISAIVTIYNLVK